LIRANNILKQHKNNGYASVRNEIVETENQQTKEQN
jgi:hypothetical protein